MTVTCLLSQVKTEYLHCECMRILWSTLGDIWLPREISVISCGKYDVCYFNLCRHSFSIMEFHFDSLKGTFWDFGFVCLISYQKIKYNMKPSAFFLRHNNSAVFLELFVPTAAHSFVVISDLKTSENILFYLFNLLSVLFFGSCPDYLKQGRAEQYSQDGACHVIYCIFATATITWSLSRSNHWRQPWNPKIWPNRQVTTWSWTDFGSQCSTGQGQSVECRFPPQKTNSNNWHSSDEYNLFCKRKDGKWVRYRANTLL